MLVVRHKQYDKLRSGEFVYIFLTDTRSRSCMRNIPPDNLKTNNL